MLKNGKVRNVMDVDEGKVHVKKSIEIKTGDN